MPFSPEFTAEFELLEEEGESYAQIPVLFWYPSN